MRVYIVPSWFFDYIPMVKLAIQHGYQPIVQFCPTLEHGDLVYQGRYSCSGYLEYIMVSCKVIDDDDEEFSVILGLYEEPVLEAEQVC